jgi:hypothetical protein
VENLISEFAIIFNLCRYVAVEPGLILGEVNRLLVKYKQTHNLDTQYKMGPDPSSIDSCMVGLGSTLVRVLLQSKHQTMTPRMITAGAVHLTNLTPPGSECDPTA